MALIVLTGRSGKAAWPGHALQTPPSCPPEAPSPGPGLQYLLAVTVGLTEVAEELEGLLRRRAGGGWGSGRGVASAGHRGDRDGAEGPAVTALQDGDLQGAPGTPHLHREQGQELPPAGHL